MDPHLSPVDDEPLDEVGPALPARPGDERVEQDVGEGPETVDEHDDPIEPFAAGSMMRREVFGPRRRQDRASPLEFGVEHHQVPGHRFEVVARRHPDHRRQAAERHQATRREVEHHRPRTGPLDVGGDGAQGRRLAGATRSEHGQTAGAFEIDRGDALLLSFRRVEQTDGDPAARLVGSVVIEIAGCDQSGQVLTPRSPRRIETEPRRCGDDRVERDRELGPTLAG